MSRHQSGTGGSGGPRRSPQENQIWSSILHRPKRQGKDGLEKSGAGSNAPTRPPAAATTTASTATSSSSTVSQPSRKSSSSRLKEAPESRNADRKKEATRGKAGAADTTKSPGVLEAIGEWIVDRRIDREIRPALTGTKEVVKDDARTVTKSSGVREVERKTAKSSDVAREERRKTSSPQQLAAPSRHQKKLLSVPKKSRADELTKANMLTKDLEGKAKTEAQVESDAEEAQAQRTPEDMNPKAPAKSDLSKEEKIVSACPEEQGAPFTSEPMTPPPVRSSLKKRSRSFADPLCPTPSTPSSAVSDTFEIPGDTAITRTVSSENGTRARSMSEPSSTVRFGPATIHHLEVGPDRRLRPIRKKHRTKSGLPYLAPRDPVRRQTVPLLASPKKIKRHLQNQAAMGRYWLRTEEEEAQVRAAAKRCAEEDAQKYRAEPASTPGLVEKEDAQEVSKGEQSSTSKLSDTEKVIPDTDVTKPVEVILKSGGALEPKRIQAKAPRKELKTRADVKAVVSETKPKPDMKSPKETRHKREARDQKDVKLDTREKTSEKSPSSPGSPSGVLEEKAEMNALLGSKASKRAVQLTEPNKAMGRTPSAETKQLLGGGKTQNATDNTTRTPVASKVVESRKAEKKKLTDVKEALKKSPEETQTKIEIIDPTEPEAEKCDDKNVQLSVTVKAVPVQVSQKEDTVNEVVGVPKEIRQEEHVKQEAQGKEETQVVEARVAPDGKRKSGKEGGGLEERWQETKQRTRLKQSGTVSGQQAT